MSNQKLKTVQLTRAQISLMLTLLSIDLDAVGLERKQQSIAAALKAKLFELGD